MPDLAASIQDYLGALKRQNASPHTVRNYGVDLARFLEYFARADEAPLVESIDTLALREWMGDLYRQKLDAVTIRRKLAAVRSLFKYLNREGSLQANPARLVRTPKAPKKLPRVPTAEQTNDLIDQVAKDSLNRPYPRRDRALFELLYGCGLRISELVGLDLDDVDRNDRWLRVRGKGRKERQVPYGTKADEALQAWLAERQAKPVERAIFVNHRGTRLTDRGARQIVSLYARLLSGDGSLHPHSFRHAYATHMLSDGADLRAIQELLGHARLSTTQKYTQVSLTDLLRVYDKAHPKA